MTKYLVKYVSTATEQNKNFEGQIHTAIYGRGDKTLYYDGDPFLNIDILTAPMVREFGYSRRQDALRSWIYRNPENTNWWSTTVEIIEYEC
jgi:hypothetical protein